MVARKNRGRSCWITTWSPFYTGRISFGNRSSCWVTRYWDWLAPSCLVSPLLAASLADPRTLSLTTPKERCCKTLWYVVTMYLSQTSTTDMLVRNRPSTTRQSSSEAREFISTVVNSTLTVSLSLVSGSMSSRRSRLWATMVSPSTPTGLCSRVSRATSQLKASSTLTTSSPLPLRPASTS